jgi:hypothetical protein
VTAHLLPATARHVVLHVGMPRTGTTYLQNQCELHRAELLEQGVLYPATGHVREEGLRDFRTAGHLTWWQEGILKDDPRPVRQVDDEIAAAPGAHTVLLSSEDLFFMLDERTLERIAEALGDAQVRIVVYLRRQDRWLESMYAEAVTGGYFWLTAGFEEYVADAIAGARMIGWPGAQIRLEYGEWLVRLRDRFGTDAVHVGVYETACAQQGLFADFLRLAGMKALPAVDETIPAKLNASVGTREDVEVIRLFNRLPFPSEHDYRRFLGTYHAWAASRDRQGRPEFFSPSARAAVLDRYATANARVAREFLGSAHTDPFPPSDPRRAQPEWTGSISLERLERAAAIYAEVTGHRPPQLPDLAADAHGG